MGKQVVVIFVLFIAFSSFSLAQEIPTITSIVPHEIVSGEETVVRVEGSGFTEPLGVWVAGILVTDKTVVRIKDEHTIYYTARPGAAIGTHEVKIVTLTGESNTANVTVIETNNKETKPTTCKITSVTWDEQTAVIGETITFRAEATDETCDGRIVEFDIVEEDFFGRTKVNVKASAYFEGRTGVGEIILLEKFFGEHINNFWEFGTGEFRLVTEDTDLSLITGYAAALASTGTSYSGILSITNKEDEEKETDKITDGGSIPAPGLAIANEVTITPRADATIHPTQIGRIFTKGEIANYPQVLIDGTAIDTQADVKTRWSDGSVQHAILTFYITNLKNGTTKTLTFKNQNTGRNTGEVPATIFDPTKPNAYNFSASITLVNNNYNATYTSAEQMLTDGNYKYWTKGDLATTFILADHTTKRKYDLGDTHRSFRPLFHVTFFPKTKQTRVRYIGEISNPDKQQNMNYDLELTIHKQGTIAYTQKNVPHNAGARWTKEYWIDTNGQMNPPTIEIDHNLAHLKDAGFFPNYDTTLTITPGTIAELYKKWSGSNKQLFDKGAWIKDMGTPGGRLELAPFPGWTVWWLFTGDERMKEYAFGQADLAAAWPMHFRESQTKTQNPRRVFDDIGTDALGKPLSPRSRNQLWIFTDSNRQYSSNTGAADKFVKVGTTNNNGWNPDCQHHPDPYSAQYLLTGDYWYYEQMHFWASWAAFFGNYQNNHNNGRGMTGAEGGFWDVSRGMGWCGRSRARMAFLAPDNSKEKALYTELTNEMLAAWEGAVNITGHFQTHNKKNYRDTWKWGNDYYLLGKGKDPAGGNDGYDTDKSGKPLGPPPLGHIGRVHGGINTEHSDSVSFLISPWMENILLYSLGNIQELGFESDQLVAHQGGFLVNLVTQNPNVFDPYLSAQYRLPVKSVPKQVYYKNLTEAKSHYNPSRLTGAKGYFIGKIKDTQFGYTWIAFTAASYITHLKDGDKAYDWFRKEVYNYPGNGNDIQSAKAEAAKNPSWAILPRTTNNTHPTITALKLNANEPEIKNVSNQQNALILVFGTNFETDATVLINGRIDSRINSQRSNNQLMLFTIPKDYPTGNYLITVQSKGRQSNNKPLTVWDGQPIPTLDTITPNEIFNDVDKQVVLSGKHFGTKATPVVAGVKWAEQNVTQINGTDTITLQFGAGAGIGAHDTSIIAENGKQTNNKQLTIKPYIESVTPTNTTNNKKNTMSVRGGTYTTNTKLYVDRKERTITNTGKDPRLLTFETDIGEATGYRSVTVQENGQESNDNRGFIVNGPTFTFSITVNPQNGTVRQGETTRTTVTITKTAVGSSGTVTLSAPNTHQNLGTTFTPSTCVFKTTEASCESQLHILASPQMNVGKQTITIQGNSSKETKTTTYELDITQRPATGTPVLQAIIPNRISNRVYTDISIIGTNFTEIAGLKIGTIILPVNNTVPINGTLIRYLADKGTPTNTYSVRVINIDGKESNPINLTVEDSPATQQILDTDLDKTPNTKDKCLRTPGKLHAVTEKENGCPTPRYGTLSKQISTNFSRITNPRDITELQLGILNKALIRFLENVQLVRKNKYYQRYEAIDIENNLRIQKNSVLLDSTNLPELNVKTEITFYNTSIKNLVPYRDGNECGNECKQKSYDTKTTDYVIEVDGWSEYEIREGNCGDGYCSITETKTSCSKDCGETTGNNNPGGGGGGKNTKKSTAKTITINLDDGKKHRVQTEEGTIYDVKVNGNVYRIQTTKIISDTITLQFINISKLLTMQQTQTYHIDLDLEGTEDIELTQQKEKNEYYLTLQKVIETNKKEKENEQTTSSTKNDSTNILKELPQQFKPSKIGFWILLTGILTLIAGITWTIKGKKHQ